MRVITFVCIFSEFLSLVCIPIGTMGTRETPSFPTPIGNLVCDGVTRLDPRVKPEDDGVVQA